MPDSFLKQQCKKLSVQRKSAVVALVLPDDSLYPTHLLKVQKCLEGKSFESMDVLLHSGGGDINTAYQTAEMLRNHSKAFRVIVPIFAKSAATLLTLAADEIIMGELAELGPLDTQILERQKGSRKYTSALNPFKSLEQLQSFSFETLDLAVKLFLNRAALTVDEAIARAIEFAANVSTPLYSKLDIEKLGEYSRALAVGKEYGERLLRRYTKWKHDDEARTNVLDKLVRGYPSHDYIIDFKEMQELGFEVRNPSEEEKPLIDAIAHYLVDTSATEIFCVCEPVQEPTDGKGESAKQKEASNAEAKSVG
jgi:hypothetical protein